MVTSKVSCGVRGVGVKVAQGIGHALADLGVEQCFGVVGSGNFIVTSTLCRRGARFVAARHEMSAVAMADGYARVTRRPGIATVHQGPGFTNALTGMTEAAKAHSPVLLVAADTPAAWVDSNFRIDQAAVASGAGIATERIHGPTTAADDLARAWRQVTVDRTATVLLLPLDVQGAEVAGPFDPVVDQPPAPSVPAPDAVAEAADLIEAAERPVIVAGRGAMLADARLPLVRLGEVIGAPLATSLNAHGLFAGSPTNLGVSGGFATPLAAEVIGQADLILAFGASLNRWTTRHGRLIGASTRVLQVDVDRSALGSRTHVDLGIVADAAATATALHDAIVARGSRRPDVRTGELAERIGVGNWRNEPFEEQSTRATVDPRTLTIAFDEILPTERTLTVDGGHFSGWPVMFLSVPDADGFVFNQSYQSIGLGMGAAIGTALGRPDRLAVAAVGDGGLFMALGELETAARLGVAMVVLVYNDDAYGAEVHHFEPEGHPLDIVRFPPTDVAAIARATGADGVTVRSVDDLAAVVKWVEAPRERPLVVDVKVTPTVIGAWLPEAFRA